MKEAILDLISSKEGYLVEIFGLSVCRLEDGRYAVTDPNDVEHVYESAAEAVDKFLALRQERRFGFDFEKE